MTSSSTLKQDENDATTPNLFIAGYSSSSDENEEEEEKEVIALTSSSLQEQNFSLNKKQTSKDISLISHGTSSPSLSFPSSSSSSYWRQLSESGPSISSKKQTKAQESTRIFSLPSLSSSSTFSISENDDDNNNDKNIDSKIDAALHTARNLLNSSDVAIAIGNEPTSKEKKPISSLILPAPKISSSSSSSSFSSSSSKSTFTPSILRTSSTATPLPNNPKAPLPSISTPLFSFSHDPSPQLSSTPNSLPDPSSFSSSSLPLNHASSTNYEENQLQITSVPSADLPSFSKKRKKNMFDEETIMASGIKVHEINLKEELEKEDMQKLSERMATKTPIQEHLSASTKLSILQLAKKAVSQADDLEKMYSANRSKKRITASKYGF